MPDTVTTTKKFIEITRVNASGGLDKYYPKTSAGQVFIGDDPSSGKTMADHVSDTDVHLSSAERSALTATNKANGYVKLDAQGFVPSSLVNPSTIAINTEFATITDLLAASVDDVFPGEIVMVTDATADPSVTAGWAIYRRPVASTKLSELSDWQKIAESESLDLVLSWDNIQNKPTSTVAAIDQAVKDDHTHANKAVLDGVTDTGTTDAPVLAYKGKALAYSADSTNFFVQSTETVPAGAKTGDFVFIES